MRGEIFFGKPCRHGHGGKRYVNNRQCVECKRAKQSGSRYKKRMAEMDRLRRYGVTSTEYNFTFAGQNFCCGICKADAAGGRGNFHVDHCHDTNDFRGVLCHSCNTSLGHFKDSTELLQAAIEYLCKTSNSTPLTSEMDGRPKHSLPIAQNESRHTNWSAGLL